MSFKIERKSLEEGTDVYFPRGERVDWEKFMPFFNTPEPVIDSRKSPRPQRRLFLFEGFHVKKFSYLISPRRRDKLRGFFFQKTPAKRQMEYYKTLAETGISTVLPVFAIERKKKLKKESLLITPLKRLPLMSKDLLSQKTPLSLKMELFEKALLDIRRMHKNGIYHGDAHTENILVDSGNILWCDLDRMRKCRLILELKGRLCDCYFLFRSTAAQLITWGGWDREVKKRFLDVFENTYPGYKRVKKSIYSRCRKTLKGF